MTTEQAGGQLTDAEVAEFARKMGEWGEGLTAKERVFIASIVARAAAAPPDDVQCYALTTLRTRRPASASVGGGSATALQGR